MNKPLSPAELAQLSVPIDGVLTMTRRERLQHWASLVRAADERFQLFHGLEYAAPAVLRAHQALAGSAFALAVADPVLQRAGLTDPSMGGVMDFFDLSQSDLHAFSCDCGGEIDNAAMADRIEHLGNFAAARSAVVTPMAGKFSRIVNGITRSWSSY